jgi:hypothetical protein
VRSFFLKKTMPIKIDFRGRAVVVLAAAVFVLGILPTLLAVGSDAAPRTKARKGFFVGRPYFEGAAGSFKLGRDETAILECRKLEVEYARIFPGVRIRTSRRIMLDSPRLECMRHGVRTLSASAGSAVLAFSLSKQEIILRKGARLSYMGSLHAESDDIAWNRRTGWLKLSAPYVLRYHDATETVNKDEITPENKTRYVNLKTVEKLETYGSTFWRAGTCGNGLIWLCLWPSSPWQCSCWAADAAKKRKRRPAGSR